MKPLHTLFGALLLLAGCASSGMKTEGIQTTPGPGLCEVNLDRGSYTGRLFLDRNPLYDTTRTVYLSEGSHLVDNGSALGGTSFIVVTKRIGEDPEQWEIAVSNPVACSVSGNTLNLNTVKVTVDPGLYGKNGGLCQIESYLGDASHGFPAGKWIKGQPVCFDLIPGLAYRLNLGTVEALSWKGNYLSCFNFLVREDGTAYPDRAGDSGLYPASGGKGSLRLNAGLATIVPLGPQSGEPYRVGFGKGEVEHTGPAKVPVVLGMWCKVTNVSNGLSGGFNPYYAVGDDRRFLAGGRWFACHQDWADNR